MLLDPDNLHAVQRQGGAGHSLHAYRNIAWTSACVSAANRKPGLIKAQEQPSATLATPGRDPMEDIAYHWNVHSVAPHRCWNRIQSTSNITEL